MVIKHPPTFINENGQTVAMDANGSWKVYSAVSGKFGAYAKGPHTQTLASAPAGVIPQATSAQPAVDSAEVARLRDELASMESLKVATERTLTARTNELADANAELAGARSDLAAMTAERNDQTYRWAQAEDEARTQVLSLTAHLVRIEGLRNDAVHDGAQAENEAHDLRTQVTTLTGQVAALQSDLDNTQEAHDYAWDALKAARATPPAAPVVAPAAAPLRVPAWVYNNAGKVVVGGMVVAVFALYLIAVGAQSLLFKPVPDARVSSLQMEIAKCNTSLGGATAERDLAKSAQSRAERERDTANSSIASLKKDAEDSKAALAEALRGKTPPALKPDASKPPVPPVVAAVPPTHDCSQFSNAFWAPAYNKCMPKMPTNRR